MKKQLPQGTVLCTFKEKWKALEERPTEFTGDQAAPQLDSIVPAKVNYCKTSHWKYCPNIVCSSMAIFKKSITSSQYVALKYCPASPRAHNGPAKCNLPAL